LITCLKIVREIGNTAAHSGNYVEGLDALIAIPAALQSNNLFSNSPYSGPLRLLFLSTPIMASERERNLPEKHTRKFPRNPKRRNRTNLLLIYS
jgi:hypothetical protein